MKRKTIILAVVAAAAMALSLVGCGVKITNIAVPDAVTVEKARRWFCRSLSAPTMLRP